MKIQTLGGSIGKEKSIIYFGLHCFKKDDTEISAKKFIEQMNLY